jgi:isoleucyl-tRNA synthetase
MKRLRAAVEQLTTDQIRAVERGEVFRFEDIEMRLDDFVVKRTAKAGIKASASSGQITILLDTMVTKELKLEGFAREFVNRVQKLRKDSGFDVADRIVVSYMTACPQLTLSLSEYQSYIMREVLAVEMSSVNSEVDLPSGSGTNKEGHEIGGKPIVIGVARVQG